MRNTLQVARAGRLPGPARVFTTSLSAVVLFSGFVAICSRNPARRRAAREVLDRALNALAGHIC